MGIFSKKTEEQKEALRELKTYTNNKRLRYREIIPRYGVMKEETDDLKCYNHIITTIRKEIENNETKTDDIERRIHELLTEKYGEPMSQEQALEELNKFNQQIELEHGNKTKEKQLKIKRKIEEKYNVDLTNKTWFKCTLEEIRYRTFSNAPERDLMDAYVIINEDNFEILKESMFIKSNMGTRKIYFQNITSLDFDARGKFNLSSSVVINTKSNEHITLKHVKEYVQYMNNAFESYIEKSQNIQENYSTTSAADEILKYAELYEKGLLTKEEFNMKKAELLGNPITDKSNTSLQEENTSTEENVEQNYENAVNQTGFCPNCGTAIKEKSNFCVNCGNKL